MSLDYYEKLGKIIDLIVGSKEYQEWIKHYRKEKERESEKDGRHWKMGMKWHGKMDRIIKYGLRRKFKILVEK